MIPDWLDAELVAVLARGALFTVGLTIITTAAASAIGLWWGVVRLTGTATAQRFVGAAISVFRNVPALIQIIFWAFAVPNLFPTELRRTLFFANPVADGLGAITGLPLPYYGVAAALGLTLNTSAYVAELFRAGAATIPAPRLEVARTLGADPRHVTRTILVPDAVRAAFPAIATRLIHNMKNTALASFVAVPELFHEMQATITKTFLASEMLLLTAVLYLALTGSMTLALRYVERHLNHGRPTAGQRRLQAVAGG